MPQVVVVSCLLLLLPTLGGAIDPRALSEAVVQVLRESEMSQCQTLYVHTEYSKWRRTRYALQDVLDELLPRQRTASWWPAWSLSQQRELSYKPYKHAVVLLVDDMAALRRLYAGQAATSNLSYTLIYMLQPDPDAAMQLLWQLSVLNAGLLVPGEDQQQQQQQQLLLLSYYPFSATNADCNVMRSTVVNRFGLFGAARRWSHRLYFPPKLNNFYGCRLTCATWPDMPYLVLRDDGDFIGIEGALLQFMAANLNFTLGLYWMNQSQVKDTFNETGWIFEQMFENSAEFALGGFHYKPSDESASEVPYSQSMYYFMSHIMLVTNLPVAYSAYEKLAFPFHPQLWQAIGLVLAMSYFSVWLQRRYFHNWLQVQHPYYQLLVLTMGGNVLDVVLPIRSSVRLLFITWLLGTLVLRSAYQSGMYQLLRQDTQRNPPQTIADVLAQHYTIQLVDGNADRWLESLPELRTQRLRHLAVSELQSFGHLAASSGTNQRLAIITPYEYFGYFRKVHAMSRRLHLVRERIFTQQLAFNVRRHSHLVGVLNDQILLAHSHGFLEHWTRQYVSAVDERDESIARISAVPYDTVDALHPDGSNVTSDDDDEPTQAKLRVLSLKELAAPLWLTLWAHLVAMGVFALEHLHSRQWLRLPFN